MIFKKEEHIFFCGIGGIGMSGLAKILVLSGFYVSGSDVKETRITKDLEKLGVKVFIPQKNENIKGIDVFIYSAAIPETNPEYRAAKNTRIKILSRSELLGIMMAEKKGIAVAGTHGKTTTSTMLSLVLEDARLDPTMVIGGEVKNIGGNAKKGNGDYFVAEACEYERSFLDLHPFGAIITNIEEDHLDSYDNLEDIIKSFKKFSSQIDESGFLTVCTEDKNMMHLNGSFSGKILTYGFSSADYVAKNIGVKGHETFFDVYKNEECLGPFSLIIPGKHNVLNALSVITTADYLKIDLKFVNKTLEKFRGARRRFEIKGQKNGVLVIDDYAHHPTEIRATLLGIAGYYKNKRIWAVFQPHQYSRTRLLFDDFAASFAGVHRVIIPDIYEARDTEADKKAVSGEKLAGAVDKISGNAKYIGGFNDITDFLEKNVEKGDLIITLGAGPVYEVGERYLSG